MLAFSLSGRDLAVVVVLGAFVALLLYLIVRREPLTRIVRFGLFVERETFAEEEKPEAPPPDEQATERWPKRDE